MSDNVYNLGQVAGLDLSVRPSAIVGFVLVWASWTGVAALLFDVPGGGAIVGGLTAAVLHWVSEIVHNLGHAWAARRTGYPMTGIRLWGVLATSVYPSDEGPLPAGVHIRRAVGGPVASLSLTFLAAAVALTLRSVDGVFGLVGLFFFLDNLLVYSLGALLPLGFTDGSTLRRWWSKL